MKYKISAEEKEEIRAELIKKNGAKCTYCGINQEDFTSIWGKFYITRGRLEIDRMDNKKGYVNGNCTLACAICNNAKSNKFTYDEMIKVGKMIEDIWKARKSIKMIKLISTKKRKIKLSSMNHRMMKVRTNKHRLVRLKSRLRGEVN